MGLNSSIPRICSVSIGASSAPFLDRLSTQGTVPGDRTTLTLISIRLTSTPNCYTRMDSSLGERGRAAPAPLKTTWGIAGGPGGLPDGSAIVLDPEAGQAIPLGLPRPLPPELQRNQPGLSRRDIRNGVGDPSRDPGDFPGLERAGRGGLPLDLVA